MSSRRVLITGVGGFVGAHLARSVVERGDIALGCGLERASAAVRGLLEQDWQADVREAAPLLDIVAAARPDAVVHLAGQSSAAASFQEPVETYRSNVLGTWNLLEAVRGAAPRARVLVVGTSEVYGTQPENRRVTESALFRPLSPYALSRAAADTQAEWFGRLHRIDIVRTRSFSHAGPGQTDRFAIPSFARQIAAIEAGRAEPVLRVGNLDVVRDVSDVRDVVEAYQALLDRGLPGRAYNVCRGEGVRLRDVVVQLIALARVEVRTETDPERLRPADVNHLVGDPGAIERDVGWHARIPLERTLEDTLEEWRSRAEAS